MTIDSWIMYIDNNVDKDKLSVLFHLVVDKKITYTEFQELLKYIMGEVL